MQVFKSIIHLLGLLALLTACSTKEVPTALPTPIVDELQTAVQPTPTLRSPDTAVSTINYRSLGDPYIPELGNLGYDVLQYNLQLSLDPAVSHVTGTTTIQAQATLDGLDQLSLDFIGYQIGQIRVNGLSTTFSREAGKLIIDFPHALTVGTTIDIIIDYAGEPVREPSPYVGFSESLGLQFVNEQTIYALAEPDGARYWFPANDHPRDKALFRFEITVPAGLTAVANGRLITSHSNDTTSTFTWEHQHPMATYLALVAVGPYERIDAISPGGIPLRHYAFAEPGDLDESGSSDNSRADFEAAVAVTGEAIDWMSQLFGPYPFESFGYVAADVPGASMETQTMVLLSSSMTGQRTAVHEMAHMWFGNWVSLDSWQEMWRNEGFATYVTMMWNNRDDPEGLDLEIAGAMASVAENEPQYPLGNPPPEFLFGYNTYFKGAVMVHELRQEMGDEAFFAGLRTYFQLYGGGTADDAAFQSIMEEAAGLPLDAFFTEWLN